MVFNREWLQDNILTTKETAEILKVSPVQIRNIIKTGGLVPILSASSRFFILKQDIADYIYLNPCVGKTREKRVAPNIVRLSDEDRKELSEFLETITSTFDAAKKYPIGVHNIKYLIKQGGLNPVFTKEKTIFVFVKDIESAVEASDYSQYQSGYHDGYVECKEGKPARW